MSQGIVKVTPKSPGELIVTVADPNLFGIKVGSRLSFSDPGFPVKVDDIVDCTFSSATTCNVYRVPVPAS